MIRTLFEARAAPRIIAKASFFCEDFKVAQSHRPDAESDIAHGHESHPKAVLALRSAAILGRL